MPLREFQCEKCQNRFEAIVSSSEEVGVECPKCHARNPKKLISRFAVGGQGDLRESTLHGCHDAQVSPGGCGAGACDPSGCHSDD